MSYRKQFSRNLRAGIPAVAKHLLRNTPNVLLRTTMSTVFNQIFRSEIHAGDLDFFDGKRLTITVTDIDFKFSLQKISDRLQVEFNKENADVEFYGSGDCFLQLATQEVDPDTLFFQRKLKITGDTELGLEIKNFMARQEPKEKLPHTIYNFLITLSSLVQSN